jgi:pyruvate dehydrogenase E1 component beta subunit
MPESPTAGLRFREAVSAAIAAEMRADERVVVLGEDVAKAGGVFKATAGLYEEFGAARVFDTPISEVAILGTALGAAVTGMRPVAELMFADFAAVAMDQIVNEIAKFRFMCGGQSAVPLVIRSSCGGGIGFGAQHSQTLESTYMQAPGLLLACPSTPRDAYHLLRASIRNDNPVVFLEHKALYNVRDADDDQTPPPERLGQAAVRRSGRHVTIVATMMMVPRSLEAAAALAAEGIEAEVIDLRTLVPLDQKTLSASVARTGHVVIAEEASPAASWGSHVAAVLAEHDFASLRAPIVRVGEGNMPLPYSPALEAAAIPDAARIAAGVRKALKA